MNTLPQALDDYLALRRATGFKLTEHERVLRKFIAFMYTQGAGCITTELALDWAQQPMHTSQAHRAQRLGMVRGFARYLSATDPRTEIPPQGLLPAQPQRSQPYIYSDEQVIGLIQEASRLQSPEGLRAHTYSTLFGLLAVTGMRVGEIVALDRTDVDLQQGVLTVTKGKFNKTRLIPVHESTLRKLRTYTRRRDTLLPVQSTSGFFVSDRGIRLNTFIVRYTFIRASRLIGWRKATDSHGPRLHDLRHTFAVRTLINWYRSGINPEQRLPLLSAYLGHAKVSDTYWYLSAVPELLGAVNTRLETFLGGLS
ncbi:MAG: tyrosine-type recombinase/integrase [Lentisphaerae bacterium]|jgi:integrase|nr:tyrosine-type recombinase/integrase [Lentisphaerota bacterium]